MKNYNLLTKSLNRFLRRAVFLANDNKTKKRAKARSLIHLLEFREDLDREIENLKKEISVLEDKETEYFGDIKKKVVIEKIKNEDKSIDYNVYVDTFKKGDWKKAVRQEEKLGLRGKPIKEDSK